MEVEVALRSYLLGTALTRLIGQRLYPLLLPQHATFPAVTFQRISSVRERTYSAPVYLVTARVQLSCWAEDWNDCREIAEELRLVLNGFRGSMAGKPVGSVRLLNEIDLHDPETDLYHMACDYEIVAEEHA